MTDVLNCALISGASKGIGRAIAEQLSLDHGLHILLNYASDTVAASETMTSIQQAGGSAELLPFHVQNKEEVQEALSSWKKANPQAFIRVLVNNAGITRDGLFMWMKEQDWDDVINVSLKGMYYLSQQVIKDMLRKRTGRIINVASLSGVKGMAGQTNYSAAKGGMIAATKALAQEIAKRNVTVNAVAPGFIETAMTEDLDTDRFLPLIPMGRMGQAREIAHVVSFLASDKASYITGEVIHVNGGLYS